MFGNPTHTTCIMLYLFSDTIKKISIVASSVSVYGRVEKLFHFYVFLLNLLNLRLCLLLNVGLTFGKTGYPFINFFVAVSSLGDRYPLYRFAFQGS